MIEDYIGMDLKKMVTFAVLVLGTAVCVTLLYCYIYGFGEWKSEMTMSAKLMTAAANVPAAQMPVNVPVAQMPAGTGSAGQYICPQHGAVGLPTFDAAGSPHCPCCGQIMQFSRAQNGTFALAAGVG